MKAIVQFKSEPQQYRRIFKETFKEPIEVVLESAGKYYCLRFEDQSEEFKSNLIIDPVGWILDEGRFTVLITKEQYHDTN